MLKYKLDRLEFFKSEFIDTINFLKIGHLFLILLNNFESKGTLSIDYPDWFTKSLADIPNNITTLLGAGAAVSSSGAVCEILAFRRNFNLYCSSKQSDNYSGSVLFNIN